VDLLIKIMKTYQKYTVASCLCLVFLCLFVLLVPSGSLPKAFAAGTLPSWVPAPGEVAVLTQANGKITNQFESQVAPYYDPFYYVNTVNDYSGAFKNPYWGTWGATVFWGGGHAGTNDNTVTVAEYGDSAITFKRVSDPTPWTGSTASDGTNRGNNSSGNWNSILNYTYMEGPDGQPGSPHSYGSGDIIGPENGGATYGTLVQISSSAVNRNNDAGADAAHKIDFDTTSLTTTSGVNRKWTRITNNTGTNFGGASPHFTAFVPTQNRIYYFASANQENVRWFDRNTNTYVVGSGTGFSIGESDGFDSGAVIYVPSRNLLVAMYPMGGTLKVKWMDVSVSQPTLGGTATLSQSLSVSDPWSAATWVPGDTNRIVLAGVTGDNSAAYEIEIPSNLSSTWTVTRAPFGSGQTFSPYDQQAGIGITFKKFQYDEKVDSIVYMPRANRDGANETIWVYRPRTTTGVTTPPVVSPTPTPTPTPTPVNGSCGTSNNGTFTAAPTTNLCSTGTASSVSTNTSTYTWSCGGSNGGQTAQCSATKTTVTTPIPAPTPTPTATFTASPSSVTSGGSVTLTWSSSNATSCTISNGSQSGNAGTAGTSPTPALFTSVTYTLVCTGTGGTVSKVAIVTVGSASPTPTPTPTPTSGSCGTSNGTTLTSQPTSNLCLAGTASSVTTNTSTYTWSCSGLNGGATSQCSATKTTVPQIPTVTLTASQTAINSGDTVTLMWSSINSTSCTASGGWTGAKAVSGSQTVSPTTNTTYSLSCTGAGGTSLLSSVSITVNPAVVTPPPAPTPTTGGGVVQFLTHDGDLVGDVDNSSAPSRDYWNNVLRFKWKRGGWGDWLDAQGRQFGESTSGAVPYASFAVPQPGTYSTNVTTLVNRWLTSGQNRGFYLRMKNNAWPVRFAGRTDATSSRRPVLTVVTSNGTFNIAARANATWNMSTYSIVSRSDVFELSGQQPAILHFSLDGVTGTVQSATLKVTDIAHDGGTSGTGGVVEVYEADPPQFMVPNQVTSPTLGFAYNLNNFQAIASNPNTIFSDDFATPGPLDTGWSSTPQRAINPNTNTTYARGSILAGANESFSNKRLAMKGAGGEGGQGMDAQYDELYSQYHLYLESDYGSNTDGIKIPAMGGQFGYWRTYNGGYWQMTTGNGGYPGTGLKVNNGGRWDYEGHSVRIVTSLRPADNSAYADLYALNLYPYNLDQNGPFPAFEQFPYVAIQKNNWYAIDLYMKQNSMSGTRDAIGNYSTANPDGAYKVWINGYPAFSKTDFRWRKHPEFGVEGLWLDVYHGGVQPAPYDMHYRLDRVSVAKSYIGPQRTELPGGISTQPPHLMLDCWLRLHQHKKLSHYDWLRLPLRF
jgi:hypothetical protein